MINVAHLREKATEATHEADNTVYMKGESALELCDAVERVNTLREYAKRLTDGYKEKPNAHPETWNDKVENLKWDIGVQILKFLGEEP